MAIREWIESLLVAMYFLLPLPIMAADNEPTKFWGMHWGSSLEEIQAQRKVDDLHLTNDLNTKFYMAQFKLNEIHPFPEVTMSQDFVIGLADNQLRRIEIIFMDYSEDGFERFKREMIGIYGIPNRETTNEVVWFGKVTTIQFKNFPGKKPNLMTLDFISTELTREQRSKMNQNR